jgi:hypothetical protein
MISLGIAIVAGGFYLVGYYDWCFWILIFAMANGLLGAIRAVANPEWYVRNAIAAGVEPNYVMLFATKAVIIVILAPIAWYVGKLAGYL